MNSVYFMHNYTYYNFRLSNSLTDTTRHDTRRITSTLSASSHPSSPFACCCFFIAHHWLKAATTLSDEYILILKRIKDPPHIFRRWKTHKMFSYFLLLLAPAVGYRDRSSSTISLKASISAGCTRSNSHTNNIKCLKEVFKWETAPSSSSLVKWCE